MSIKQRLISFFCVDCQRFTMTGWSCWKCHRRLCFECAGGWAMYYGYSPGFETCKSCKDEYSKAMDLRLAAYMEKYQMPNKKRRTFRTPLASVTSKISRRPLRTGRFYQCAQVNFKRSGQFEKRFSSWHSPAILDSTNRINVNIRPRSQINLCHETAFSYFPQAEFRPYWSFSWSAHVLCISSSLIWIVVSEHFRCISLNIKSLTNKIQAQLSNVRVFTLTN